MIRLAPLRVLALVLGIASSILPSTANASLRLAPAPTTEPAKPASTAATPAAATPDAAPSAEPAAEADDLSAQREAAIAERKATPTADTYHAEAELAERAGDWSAAIAAYKGELARLGKDDPAYTRAQQGLARVRERARGVVVDEGKSSHRDELDARWAEPRTQPKVAPAKADPLAERATKDDRIVKKWYFWVTIGAIVASAAAVTGIAVKASRDDKPDALDRRAVFGIGTGALRF